jgi:hypothetical protein
MVDYKAISQRMESVLKDFSIVNNEFYYERHFLSGLIWVYILSFPLYITLFFLSTNGWKLVFTNNSGYLMAGLLIVCPYLYKWAMMVYEVLSNSHRYLSEDTNTGDLRHVLRFDTDSPYELYLSSVYSMMGAAVYTVMVTVAILPLISTISPPLIESLVFIVTIPIWIELIKYIIMLVYVMKRCMIDRLNHPEPLERIF